MGLIKPFPKLSKILSWKEKLSLEINFLINYKFLLKTIVNLLIFNKDAKASHIFKMSIRCLPQVNVSK